MTIKIYLTRFYIQQLGADSGGKEEPYIALDGEIVWRSDKSMEANEVVKGTRENPIASAEFENTINLAVRDDDKGVSTPDLIGSINIGIGREYPFVLGENTVEFKQDLQLIDSSSLLPGQQLLPSIYVVKFFLERNDNLN